MGENSKIEWTDHTFNPWRGCTKVSEGCRNCYAEKQAKRNPGTLGIWGDGGTRVVAAESMWKQPLKWHREAMEAKTRRRVFCGSMCDIFEDRPELEEPRERVLMLAYECHWLDWLFLTKRPQNIEACLRKSRHMHHPRQTWWDLTAGRMHPRYNWWFGTSVESEDCQVRLNYLHDLKRRGAAHITFCSAEPLLGPLILQGRADGKVHNHLGDGGLDWVIIGGESGPNARPCNEGWIADIVRQCCEAGTAAFVKQLGSYAIADYYHDSEAVREWALDREKTLLACWDRQLIEHRIEFDGQPPPRTVVELNLKAKGGDWNEWHDGLKVREFPPEEMPF